MSSLAALIGFLLLSAPGLIYEAVREKCRPAVEHTSLREAGRVTLASVTFTSAAAVLMALIRLASPAGMFPDPGKWVTSTTYQAGHWLLAARTVIVGVVLACILAALAAWLLHRNAARMRPDPVAWLAYHEVKPKPSRITAHVKLITGVVYSGILRGIDYTGDPGVRMVALDAPFLLDGDPLAGPDCLVFPLSRAEVIGFTFEGDSEAAPKKHWCFQLRHN
jgi:hypothetical protein